MAPWRRQDWGGEKAHRNPVWEVVIRSSDEHWLWSQAALGSIPFCHFAAMWTWDVTSHPWTCFSTVVDPPHCLREWISLDLTGMVVFSVYQWLLKNGQVVRKMIFSIKVFVTLLDYLKNLSDRHLRWLACLKGPCFFFWIPVQLHCLPNCMP
jgi:hypothetical protein